MYQTVYYQRKIRKLKLTTGRRNGHDVRAIRLYECLKIITNVQ